MLRDIRVVRRPALIRAAGCSSPDGTRHPCALGRAGVTHRKREGDGASPAAVLRPIRLYLPGGPDAPAPSRLPLRPDPPGRRLVRRPRPSPLQPAGAACLSRPATSACGVRTGFTTWSSTSTGTADPPCPAGAAPSSCTSPGPASRPLKAASPCPSPTLRRLAGRPRPEHPLRHALSRHPDPRDDMISAPRPACCSTSTARSSTPTACTSRRST